MAAGQTVLPCSLLDLLSNTLILTHTSPYIGVRSLVSLAATSKAYKSLIYDTLQVFQHVDLSSTGLLTRATSDFALVNNQKVDELYAQRFSTIFSILENRNVLQDVRTLILDGFYVPNTVIEDVLCDERYQIRLLSIRGFSKLRPSDMVRILHKSFDLKGIPSIKAIYLFGQPSRAQEVLSFEDVMTRSESITASMGAQLGAGNYVADGLDNFKNLRVRDPYSDSPYGAPGMSCILEGRRATLGGWSNILKVCAGVIAFDAVLCRHDRESSNDPSPSLATVRLTGCESCGTCPEGPAYPGVSPTHHLPLLSPPPLHSSKVEVAQRIGTHGQPYPPLILRCRACLKDRWCETCNAWWCESCYTIPKRRDTTMGESTPSLSSRSLTEEIKVHNGLCVSKCLMEVLLNGIGEGGMWG